MNCRNDPAYTEKILSNFYKNYFPPKNSLFTCYVSENQRDSLLNLPDSLAYQCSMIILVFGILLGFLLIIFGLKLEIKSPLGTRKTIRKFLKDIDQNNFILNEMIYKSEKLDKNKTNECEENKLENIKLTNFSQNLKNNLTINDNINRNRALSDEDFVKLTNAGYHIGRIGYPSSTKLNQNTHTTGSLESLSNTSFNSYNSYNEPLFTLDSYISNDTKLQDKEKIQNIHSIAEEDDISMANNKKANKKS